MKVQLFVAALLSTVPSFVLSQDKQIESIISPNAKVTEIFNGGETFLEGPTMSNEGILFFSDITFTAASGMKAGYIWTLNPQTKEAKIFRSPSGMANGMEFDAAGNLVVCEMADFGGRKVTRTDMKTGKAVIVAGLFNGRPFNSPNDLAIDASNRIYFTDSRYIGYEPLEQPVHGVYRVDTDNSVHLVATNIEQPNGIVVSPDQKSLYVANCNQPGNGNTSFLTDDFKGVRPVGNASVIAFDLLPDGSLRSRGKFVDFGDNACADGMAVDQDGNLYIALGDRVEIYSPRGQKIGSIKAPQVTNLCFGVGQYSKTLFIAGGKSIYMIETLKVGYNILSRPSR